MVITAQTLLEVDSSIVIGSSGSDALISNSFVSESMQSGGSKAQRNIQTKTKPATKAKPATKVKPATKMKPATKAKVGRPLTRYGYFPYLIISPISCALCNSLLGAMAAKRWLRVLPQTKHLQNPSFLLQVKLNQLFNLQYVPSRQLLLHLRGNLKRQRNNRKSWWRTQKLRLIRKQRSWGKTQTLRLIWKQSRLRPSSQQQKRR